MSLGALAAALAFSFATTAAAAPLACGHDNATTANAPVIGGSWSMRFLDDGAANWSEAFTHVFNADGTWTENGNLAGGWCMYGNTLIYSWDGEPNATFRFVYSGAGVMSGAESWDNGGTGIAELWRN
jgi:hypothetical protein